MCPYVINFCNLTQVWFASFMVGWFYFRKIFIDKAIYCVKLLFDRCLFCHVEMSYIDFWKIFFQKWKIRELVALFCLLTLFKWYTVSYLTMKIKLPRLIIESAGRDLVIQCKPRTKLPPGHLEKWMCFFFQRYSIVPWQWFYL